MLKFTHPANLIRDTGKAPFAKTRAGLPLKESVALKKLAKILLQTQIQEGEHDSIEDAQTTMAIYRLVENEWEADLREKRKQKEKRSLWASLADAFTVIFNLKK